MSNSNLNKNRKHKLYNIDLDEDVIDIDLSQYQRTRLKENANFKHEEEQMLINTNESLDYVWHLLEQFIGLIYRANLKKKNIHSCTGFRTI